MVPLGQTAGGYEFLSIEGSSRIGTAYKVRNIVADRIEILRVLQKTDEDREQASRFLREIKVHARLTHPNLVSFYGAAEIKDQLVTTSEYFEGESLQQWLANHALSIGQAVDWMSQVLAGLEYAHDHDVVHREVSSANIRISEDGKVKLTGFGLAKSAADQELTRAGTVMGWLEYMSPEQAMACPVDSRSDIYSAGAVLYEMVTGQVPFAGKSEYDLIKAHLSLAPVPPMEINPLVSRELNQVILTALAKKPSDRFQTVRQFRDALERAGTAPAASPRHTGFGFAVMKEDLPKLVFTGVLTFVALTAALFTYLKFVRLMM